MSIATMTLLNKKYVLIQVMVVSGIIIASLLIFGLDFNGPTNNWVIEDFETDTTSKIGRIQNSEHKNDKTWIYGSFGNPLGLFDETVDDPNWKFKDGKSIIFTQVITIPTKCINTITSDSFSIIDADYKSCMSWKYDRSFKLY